MKAIMARTGGHPEAPRSSFKKNLGAMSAARCPLFPDRFDGRMDGEAISDQRAAIELLQNLATSQTTILALGPRLARQLNTPKTGSALRTRHILFFHKLSR